MRYSWTDEYAMSLQCSTSLNFELHYGEVSGNVFVDNELSISVSDVTQSDESSFNSQRDESSFNSNSTVTSITSLADKVSTPYPLTSPNSTKTSVNDVDDAVQKIMQNDQPIETGKSTNSLLMVIVDNLYEQIATLKDEICFLRTETKTKNSILNPLAQDFFPNQINKTQCMKNEFFSDTLSLAFEDLFPVLSENPVISGTITPISEHFSSPPTRSEQGPICNFWYRFV